MTETAITLEQLLVVKDRRAEMQRSIVDRFALPVISFTLCVPGAVKQSDSALRLFETGVRAVEKEFSDEIKNVHRENLDAGSFAVFSILGKAKEIKRRCCLIEEKHRYGRLFDFDVIDSDERPISRVELGFDRRKCFVCSGDGAACARSEAHSKEEIIDAVNKIFPLF